MPDPVALVFDRFASRLGTLDGVRCGVTLFGASFVPTHPGGLVDSFTGECDVTRQTFDATWDETEKVAEIAEADQWPAIADSAGEAARWAVVYCDEGADAGYAISAIRYEDFTASAD